MNIVIGGIGAFLGYVLMQSEADYKRGQALLAKNPNDTTGNLVVGAYLASQGKWEDALPYLAKSGIKELQDAVNKDTESPGGKYDQIELGDMWVKAGDKVAKYRPLFRMRGVKWYGDAWPGVANDPVWGDKLRTQLKKVQNKGGGQVAIQKLNGWPQAAGKVFSSGQYAVSGAKSVRIDPEAQTVYGYLTTGDLACQGGKEYEFSGWALSDGTDTAQDHIKMDVFSQGTRLVDQVKLALPQDTPAWKFFSYKGTFPANAILYKISLVLASKTGSVWFDDISVKVDGKELLKNPSLE